MTKEILATDTRRKLANGWFIIPTSWFDLFPDAINGENAKLTSGIWPHLNFEVRYNVMVDDDLSAQNVIESLLPDVHDRRTVLDLLIRSSQFASSIAPAAWSTTLWQNGFRLNVRQVEALTFIDTNIRIMLAATRADPRLAS